MKILEVGTPKHENDMKALLKGGLDDIFRKYYFDLQEENKELLKTYDDLEEQYKSLMKQVIEQDKRINKALELLDSYKLGKYDYALTCAGLLEFEDILRGKDNE